MADKEYQITVTAGDNAVNNLRNVLTDFKTISTDATSAKNSAQDWAESSTAPGTPGTKSAKTWANTAVQPNTSPTFNSPTITNDLTVNGVVKGAAVQSDIRDSTPGKIALSTPHGLGEDKSSGNIGNKDFNLNRVTGFYHNWAPTNGPGGTGWNLLSFSRGSTRSTQIAVRTDVSPGTNLLSVRQSGDLGADPDNWYPWREIYHSGNTPKSNYITPDMYDAPTDGSSDSSPAFQQMLNYIADKPGIQILDTFKGTRVFNSGLTSTGHVNWDAGSAHYKLNSFFDFLTVNGNATPKIASVTQNYTKGAISIHANITPTLERGDWIRVVSDAGNPLDRSRIGNSIKYRVQEFAQVSENSSSTLVQLVAPLRFAEGWNTAETSLIDTYTTAQNARVAVFKTDIKFSFKGGYFTHPTITSSSPTSHVFNLLALYKPSVSNSNMHGGSGTGVKLNGTLFATVKNCVFNDFSDKEIEDVHNGYGIADGGEYTLVDSCVFGKCRHAYTTLKHSLGSNTSHVFSGGNTLGALIKNSVAHDSTTTAFDTHHGSVDCSFVDCKVVGGEQAYGGRGMGHSLVRCSTYGSRTAVNTLSENAYSSIKLPQYATSWKLLDCDFKQRGILFTIRDTHMEVNGLNAETARRRFANVEGSILTFTGTNTIKHTQGLSRVPWEDENSVSFLTEARASALGASSLRVALNASLVLDYTDTPSSANGSAIFGISAGGNHAYLEGALTLRGGNVKLSGVSSDRFSVSPNSVYFIDGGMVDSGTLSSLFTRYKTTAYYKAS